ncbi:hypothetical protein CXB77_14745 [Chromatium okenii]|uniref:site-specific DNA-methyltransferase (adenine-specific) n=3 Tax=Chromatium okenii TaxID=61644 RepID=A0A2S7XPG9_9GAMM|nr:hypothetical protein CXB77_14745 [Chromatium okenii]
MPPAPRHREETLNTHLAVLLTEHGIDDAEPETILTAGTQRPDVMFTFNGLRVILEGKFADVADAEKVVQADAQRRVDSGICHIAAAVVYPEALRTTSTKNISGVLAETQLRVCTLSEIGATAWSEATPAELLETLRRVHHTMSQEDIVATAAQALSERIETIASFWNGQGATCDRLSELLGMPIHADEVPEVREARRVMSAKVAALVMANAMIFQEQLANFGNDPRVNTLRAYDQAPDPIADLREHWHWIWNEINYVPIFQLGERILAELPVSLPTISATRWLITEAKSICANQSALRHDLMGRIYHWLLYHAKYLGTYYTAVSSATLLLKLTFNQDWPTLDVSTSPPLAEFTVADLTCGTGTLLMAAGQAIADRFVEGRARAGLSLLAEDWKQLHVALMENVLHGYDVLPSAVHLTASTLGMLSPHVTYRRMNLFIMPLGMQGNLPRLGSLEFIGTDHVPTQLSLDNRELQAQQTGVANTFKAEAAIPLLDLCVMNPPFVRSVGGNLLFGNLPERERAQLQKELKVQVKKLSASSTAGLGSVFVALADTRLKVGGRLAFILPVALATGEAWGSSRALLAEKYTVEMVVVSHDAGRPNFSENTELSELLFIARKRQPDAPAGMTHYINLWRNPPTVFEALDLSRRIRDLTPATLTEQTITPLRDLDGYTLGEVIALPASVGEAQWIGAQFAQTWTLRTAALLGTGNLVVPGKPPVTLPLCAVSELGKLGPDQKRIHEGFKVAKHDWSPYQGFWDHNSKIVTTMAQKPNSYLTLWIQSPRGADYGSRLLWPRAGKILLAERLRTNTHRVMAVGFDRPVLGNSWWALQTELSPAQEKVLLLWLNSTPALVLLLSRRVTTQGAWMKVKQPAWAAMPVLDVRALPPATLEQLAADYDRLCEQPLLALAKLAVDPHRIAIDDALAAALGLPDLQPLRELLAREPGLTGVGLFCKPEKISRPPRK